MSVLVYSAAIDGQLSHVHISGHGEMSLSVRRCEIWQVSESRWRNIQLPFVIDFAVSGIVSRNCGISSAKPLSCPTREQRHNDRYHPGPSTDVMQTDGVDGRTHAPAAHRPGQDSKCLSRLRRSTQVATAQLRHFLTV